MPVHNVTRRSFLVGAGAIAGGTALSACGSPGESEAENSSRASETVDKVVFLTNSGDLGAKKVVDAWNPKHPDVKVELRQTDSSTYGANFPRLATSSDAPNIAGYFIDGGLYTDLAKAGSLYDMSQFWETSGMSANTPALIKDKYFSFTDDGKAYGVPTNTSRYGILFYRKSILEKAGVTAPANHEWASLEEFEEACDKLKAAKYSPISVGGKDGYPLSHIQDGLLSSTMEADTIASPLDVVYTSDEWKLPIQKMVDWNRKGYFARGYLGRSADQGNTFYGQGKAGFNTGMNVWIPLMVAAKVPVEDLDWCLLPPIGDLPTKVSIYAGGGIVIPQVAKGREQTLQFATYVVSKENALSQAKTDQVIPARTDVDGLADALGPIAGSMYEFAAQDGRSQFGWDDAAPTDMINYDRQNLQVVLAGRQTVDDFSKELENLKGKQKK